MARAGKNDSKLAEAAGTTRQQIHKLRHGERKLTVEWAKRLAPHLDVSWQELITRSPPSPAEQTRAALNAAIDAMDEEQRHALLVLLTKGPISMPRPEVSDADPRPKRRASGCDAPVIPLRGR